MEPRRATWTQVCMLCAASWGRNANVVYLDNGRGPSDQAQGAPRREQSAPGVHHASRNVSKINPSLHLALTTATGNARNEVLSLPPWVHSTQGALCANSDLTVCEQLSEQLIDMMPLLARAVPRRQHKTL